jgi:hypothetical protein
LFQPHEAGRLRPGREGVGGRRYDQLFPFLGAGQSSGGSAHQ